MAVVGRRLQIGMKETGESTIVAGNNTAKLMYYLDCICRVINIDSDGDCGNLRNYRNWHELDDDDITKLLTVCLLLDPDELTGKCIFEVPADTIDCDNEFYELSANQVQFVAVQNIIIGGQTRRVAKIMVYERSWLQNYYHRPIHGLIEEIREKHHEQEDVRQRENAREQEDARQKEYICQLEFEVQNLQSKSRSCCTIL